MSPRPHSWQAMTDEQWTALVVKMIENGDVAEVPAALAFMASKGKAEHAAWLREVMLLGLEMPKP